MNSFFDSSIKTIKGVGDVRLRLFNRLGVDTVGALLRFYPHSYVDWSDACDIISAPRGETARIYARVLSGATERFVRKGMTLYTLRAADRSGVPLYLTFFNNRFIGSMLKTGEDYIFCGRLTYENGYAQMASPAFRPAGQTGVEPVYRQTEGLPSRVIAQTVREALHAMPQRIDDPLDSGITERNGLCSLRDALCMVHLPQNDDQLAQARRRLAFDELLALQLGLSSLRERYRGENALPLEKDMTEDFFALLPFSPTAAQRRVTGECVRDMMHGAQPMSRLVQGDVGSGKTVVAAALCYSFARCGCQSALMAPTEILAEQHYRTLSTLLDGTGINVVLLTGSVSGARRKEIYAALADGSAAIAVGTHALITEGVAFSRLALVITDEQHRFGVGQRAALSAKGRNPHLLAMSATPIPRTLALVIFGDLDVSVIDELPAGRVPIETLWITGAKRNGAYGFIKKQLDAGRQGYIICPAVDDSGYSAELAAAEEYAAHISAGAFSGYRVGVLHGRMKPADKDYVMRSFARGDIQLLVSTTVVEVGVDVPNASIMLIENAERFGLSQLHQLRGRVGRGQYKSYCILLSDSSGDNVSARLGTMLRTNDGFEISQEDLRLRGPGDFFGHRQHGLPELNIADLSADMQLLSAAQAEAGYIIADDPDLSRHPLLRQETQRLFSEEISFS